MGITYYRRREQGLCPTCGLVHTNGKWCDNCREKRRLKTENMIINMSEEEYEELREYRIFTQNKRVAMLKEQGLCTRCGKQSVRKGYVNCYACRKKHRASNKKYTESRRR